MILKRRIELELAEARFRLTTWNAVNKGLTLIQKTGVMSMKIKVHCNDGGDRNCYRVVEIDLPFKGLTCDNVIVNWIKENDKDVVDTVKISPPATGWIKQQDENLLKPSDIKAIEDEGFFEIAYDDLGEYSVDLMVCAACGSDQTY